MTEPNEISAENAAGEENVIPSTYVGVKRIEAWPELEPVDQINPTQGDPLAQRDPRPGYAVRYPDGYVSWSPADVFEAAYQQVQPDKAEIAVDAAQTILNAIANGVEINFTEGKPADSGLAVGEAAAAEVSTAPRVSLFDIERKVAGEYAFTLAQAVGEGVPITGGMAETTIAVIVMENGTTVIGKSAPASPENFNDELGRRFAREDAIRQVWPLEGYLLKQRLYCQAKAKEALADAPAGNLLGLLGTDAQLWASAFVFMLDSNGAFPNAEAADEFGDIALGWFANALEMGRDEGLRQNPSFDPDAKETPNFKAILDDEMQNVGYPNADSLTALVLEATSNAMGRAYAHGLARTTFPSRQMGEMAAGIIHEPGTDGWPVGVTAMVTGEIDTPAEQDEEAELPVGESRTWFGNVRVPGYQGAAPSGIEGSGTAAAEPFRGETRAAEGRVTGFRIGEGFTRDSERDPAAPRE
jgi:hypothetical protein